MTWPVVNDELKRVLGGPLVTDMGLDGGPLFAVTPRGIAVVVDGRLRGYVSADELGEVARVAIERCPTCGQPKDAWRRLEAVSRP